MNGRAMIQGNSAYTQHGNFFVKKDQLTTCIICYGSRVTYHDILSYYGLQD
jgi:hypothetical protein